MPDNIFVKQLLNSYTKETIADLEMAYAAVCKTISKTGTFEDLVAVTKQYEAFRREL